MRHNVLESNDQNTCTIFPQIETAVTKHFSSIVPRFQFEGWLLYEGRLLIFHQGCGLVIRYCMAGALLLYNICMHAVPFRRKRFWLKKQFFFTDAHFVYMKTVKMCTKMHETIFTSKTLSRVETFEKLNLSRKHRKNGSENATKVCIFPEAFPEAFLCKHSPRVNNWMCAVSKRGAVTIGNRMCWVRFLNEGWLVLEGQFLFEEIQYVFLFPVLNIFTEMEFYDYLITSGHVRPTSVLVWHFVISFFKELQ